MFIIITTTTMIFIALAIAEFPWVVNSVTSKSHC